MLRDLPTDSISVRSDARAINTETVAALAESIATIGLINPPRVRALGEGWELIAGAHRLEAHKSLGLAEVTCDVVESNDDDAELAMADENLVRVELSPAERAAYMARKKAAYEKRHGENVRGRGAIPKNQKNAVPSFVAATAEATGQSDVNVWFDVSRGENILPEVLEKVRGTELDKGVYLDKLKKMPGSEQYRAVERDLSHIRTKQREKNAKTKRSKIDADVKSRAAKEVAEVIAEHVPAEWWDAVKANLYAAGASNIANELTNVTGQSIMDRSAA